MNWKVVLLGFVAALVALQAGVLALGGNDFLGTLVSPGRETNLAAYAQKTIETCSEASYKPSCYDREIPKLMDKLSMEQALEVTRIVQEQDQNYWYCHVLGHEVASRETAKDPDNWKEVIARCPSGMCSNGCIHGAFQERFRAESLPEAEVEELKPVLTDICEGRPGWEPTGLEKGTCYHALGHLSMYITEADVEKSIFLCQEVVPAAYQQICFDGAFMQIFQPLEPEDFALIEGKRPGKEEVAAFCDRFPKEQKSSCWSESWPLSHEEIMRPEGLVEFCSFVADDAQETRCYNALFYVIAAQFALDEEKVGAFCRGLPEDRMGQCFANASSRMIETDARLVDRSVSLCRAAEEAGVGEACYKELLLYSTYNFHAGSEDFFRLCSALPDPWSAQCLARSP